MAHLRRARRGMGWEAHQLVDHRLARMPLEEWAEEWLTTAVHLEPKTRAGYESNLRRRVLPRFAGVPVAAVEGLDVRRFVAELAEAGDAPGTIRNTFNVLHLVFATALESGALRTNPCRGLRLPRSRRQEMLFLEPPQLLSLADAITPRYRALILVAGYTGLRAGEIGALRGGRVDLVRGTLTVQESLAEVKGKLIFGPTKTHAIRTVRLPPSCGGPWPTTSSTTRPLPAASSSRARPACPCGTTCSRPASSSPPSPGRDCRGPCGSTTCGTRVRRC